MHKWVSIFLLSCLILLNCNSNVEKVDLSLGKEPKSEKTLQNKQFFDFDRIDYYRLGKDSGNIEELYDNRLKSKLDSFKLGVIRNEIPNNILDTTFIDKIDQMGFEKTEILTSKYQIINKIFSEKKMNSSVAYACKPVYRDILVFKKNNKTVGISKICFECKQHRIFGTNSPTDDFGQDGDYEKLDSLLNIENVKINFRN